MLLGLTFGASAQGLTMSVKAEPTEDTSDLDARVYHSRLDQNDQLCALIKVTPTNPLKNELVLEVGGLGVTDREERDNGEIWFWVPAQVKNLNFSCSGYTTPPPVPVRLKEGVVYRITLHTDATFETVQNAVLDVAFLKILLNVEGAVVSLGRTPECEMHTKSLSGKLFTLRLNYDTYYYKIEHPLYESVEGVVEVKAGLGDLRVELKPAFGYLHITSDPEGAQLYVDGREVGTTPWKGEERYGRGEVELRIVAQDYYPMRQRVAIAGEGGVEKFHFDLKPQFGLVECVCDDPEAEIWIDEEYKGKGRWTGRVGSLSQHIVEARRAGHKSQSAVVDVAEGERTTCRVGAPVAMWGALEVQTTPEMCNISVDGEAMGTTPTILQLLVGTHRIRLSAEGYNDVEFVVEVPHNEVVTVAKTLEAGKRYRVGDYYDDGTKQGVVFEVSADGNHGKIVSLKQSSEELKWADYSVCGNRIKADSRTYGAANMKRVQAISGWREKYPAFRWCVDLGEGWYLPAIEELRTLLLDESVHKAVNATLKARGATRLDDVGELKWYWSSTEYFQNKFCAWLVYMSGGYSSYYNKTNSSYVRAVSAF